jgi:uncharacterized protein
MIHRIVTKLVFEDIENLKSPMSFLSGPRQVGKTHLVRQSAYPYFNWDTAEVKTAALRDPYFFRGQGKVVLFDEIHKRRDWKKILKGYYDSPERAENFIITGSGRFDAYRKSGDSLAGRYLNSHLWPLHFDETVCPTSEINQPRNFMKWEPPDTTYSDESLKNFGGFPAAFLKGSESFLRRWQNQYIERLVKEDVRDFSQVILLDKIELLARMLPNRICSPLSEKSLSEDLDVSHVAIKSWMKLFEQVYLGFSVRPFSKNIARAIKKERKWYFYQWTFAEDKASLLENYVAVQLAAALSAWTDAGYGKWELCYLRDQDRREVDFVIVQNMTPKALIEVKSTEPQPTAALKYYCEKLGIPGYMLTDQGGSRKWSQSVWSMGTAQFLKGLMGTGSR